MQPIPPLINCNVPVDQQDPYCKLGVSPNFCLFKQQGIYEHPSFCDYFILCGSDPRVVSVHRCPSITGYNPHIFNCDYTGYLRCVSINRGRQCQQLSSKSSIHSVSIIFHNFLNFKVNKM